MAPGGLLASFKKVPMHRINDDGLYEGSNVQVYKRSSHGQHDLFQVIADSTIWIETRHVEVANGIAATMQSLTPTGSPFRMEVVLDTLTDLVGARQLLAQMVDREATALGKFSDAVRSHAKRLYGDKGYS